MTTTDRYAMPTELDHAVPGAFDTNFRWEYDDGREKLINLYRKGKKLQWDADERIDWSQDLDPENPAGLPDEAIPIFGWEGFAKLTREEKANLRHHYQAWQMSQFLHGEQGALICTAKIVQQVPSMDAKYYAANQVADEARHVESYARLLHEKYELTYPITPYLAHSARPDHRRLALGHHLLGDADPDRGLGAGGVPAHPRQRAESARGLDQCLRHAR